MPLIFSLNLFILCKLFNNSDYHQSAKTNYICGYQTLVELAFQLICKRLSTKMQKQIYLH